MSVPRTRSGRPLKHLGRGYFVLLDLAQEEVSERAPGEAWLAVDGPHQLTVILHPDSTDRHGMVSLQPRGRGVAHYFATCLDDVGPIAIQPTGTLVWPHDTFNIDWNPMLDVMA